MFSAKSPSPGGDVNGLDVGGGGGERGLIILCPHILLPCLQRIGHEESCTMHGLTARGRPLFSNNTTIAGAATEGSAPEHWLQK